jgi:hypothetical protein
MTTDVAAARNELQRASDAAAGGDIQRQMNSIDEGLMELVDGDKVEGEGGPKPDRLTELEEKLAGLGAETDDREVLTHIENALDHLDAATDGFGEA